MRLFQAEYKPHSKFEILIQLWTVAALVDSHTVSITVTLYPDRPYDLGDSEAHFCFGLTSVMSAMSAQATLLQKLNFQLLFPFGTSQVSSATPGGSSAIRHHQGFGRKRRHDR
jgi:hypothetical protein